MRGVHRELEERLELVGNLVPALGIGEIRADPSAGKRVGQEVLAGICPSDGVVFGNTGPRHAVKRTRPQSHFRVFIGKRNGNDSELGEELAGGREGVNLQPLEVGQGINGLFGGEMTRIPRACRKPCHFSAGSFLVRLCPNLVETVLREKHRHIERVARSKREIAAKHAHIGRGRH